MDIPFRDVNILLCGDFHQFPPVGASGATDASGGSRVERWRDMLTHLQYGWVAKNDIEMLCSLIITYR